MNLLPPPLRITLILLFENLPIISDGLGCIYQSFSALAGYIIKLNNYFL